jgi:voltage-gated potassium channel
VVDSRLPPALGPSIDLSDPINVSGGSPAKPQSYTEFEMKKRFIMKPWLRWFAGRNEILMFSLALVYLICLAMLIVIWVYSPVLVGSGENIGSAAMNEFGELSSNLFSGPSHFALVTMFMVWCIVSGEAVVHWLTRPWNRQMRRHHAHSLLFVICPALRMCARSPEMNGRIWLPGLGWRRGGRRLQRQLERHFSVPMMVIAILIMPMLIIEFLLKDQVATYVWLRRLLEIGMGVIWFAFAAEFILMVSIVEKKLAYCKEHWIDVAIILLPLASFLRSLSIIKATKLANLLRIPQLSNLARAYRLRGTAIKALRVLILFDLTHRILRVSDKRRIEKMEIELEEMEKHSRLLRQKIAKLKMKADRDEALPKDPQLTR